MDHDRIEGAAHWLSRLFPWCYLMRHGSDRSRSAFGTDAPMVSKTTLEQKKLVVAHERADCKQVRLISHSSVTIGKRGVKK